MPACIIKKRIRKIPVNPMMNFLPIEDVKKCFQVIVYVYDNFCKVKAVLIIFNNKN
jgi:hypothetical protein